MIMQEQELTLFGGWAKALIPPPTVNGVVKLSDMPSASISLSYDPPMPVKYTAPLIEVEASGEGYKGQIYAVENWQYNLLEHWKNLALCRFFEIWRKGSLADMMRGYQGTRSLQMSFSGKIGCNNDRGNGGDNGALTKLPSGHWTLTHKSEFKYRHISKLPPEGIQNARKHALKLREQRITHHS